MLIEDVVKAGGMVWHGKEIDPKTGKPSGRGVAPYKGEETLKAKDIKAGIDYYIISLGFIGQGKLTGLPNENGTATTTSGAFLYRSTADKAVNKVVELTNGEEVKFKTNAIFRVTGDMLLSNATLLDVDVVVDDVNEVDGTKKIFMMLLRGQKVSNVQLERLVTSDEFTMTRNDLLAITLGGKNDLNMRLQIISPKDDGERILSTLVRLGVRSDELSKMTINQHSVKVLVEKYLDKFVEVWQKYN